MLVDTICAGQLAIHLYFHEYSNRAKHIQVVAKTNAPIATKNGFVELPF